MVINEITVGENISSYSTAKKRRIRRKKLRAARSITNSLSKSENTDETKYRRREDSHVPYQELNKGLSEFNKIKVNIESTKPIMSSSEIKSKEEVLAAREAKKLAKLKAKNKVMGGEDNKGSQIKVLQSSNEKETNVTKSTAKEEPNKESTTIGNVSEKLSKSIDEVDRAITKLKVSTEIEKTKEQIKAERATKKAEKQSKKKKEEEPLPSDQDMTMKDVVETLKDIVIVAKEVQDVTAKVQAINLESKKVEESGKSKAELKAERRAKQDAQRAAKQATTSAKPASAPKTETITKPDPVDKRKEEKVPKSKAEKAKPKQQSDNRVNWFQHLHMQNDKDSLKKIPINSNLHPAIIKLGVQLASRVVTGSNARCIALLDALKKMVKDYTLPAKTEFARGLESHLASSLSFLWSMRPPTASQTNAVKFFRHHLTQLPNNVDEFDAKKTLQEEIDRYIREQIDMAGEAISLAVRNKISNGDNILTYGCSSLIERILREAWQAGVHFRTVIVGNRIDSGAREMLRRLSQDGLPCCYADITALSHAITSINKVIVGASSLLVNGSVVGRVGTAQVALAARAHNVPLLVACETHKFSALVHTDAIVYSELGDPDDLIDKTEDSPLKDWRSNPNLTPLNLMYDVTPPSLVTAVVTELAILPCTSAPVVLRFKLSEYGI